jgi:hypothetical protein
MAPFMANAISLDSFDSQVKNKNEQLTTLQFKEYISNLKGTKVDWSGKVLNVQSSGKGKYSIRLSVLLTPTFYSFEVLDKATALTLEKNQEYNFSGEISECRYFSLLLGLSCDIEITGFK